MAAPILLFAASSGKLNYPVPPTSNQVDDYHGSKVADPYRSLENADAPATQKFVEQENELTFSWLGKIPGREAMRTRLTALWNYEKYTGLYKAGNRYFQLHNTGLQNQSVLYVLDSLNGKPRELLDPNTYRKDGTAALTAEVGMASCWPIPSRRQVPTGMSGGFGTSIRGKTCRMSPVGRRA
jgi:prolyl oligopeptidase